MKNREYKQVWAIRARGSLYCGFLCEYFFKNDYADCLSRYCMLYSKKFFMVYAYIF